MNRAILDQIRAADVRGAPAADVKRLYLQLCAIGLDLEQPVYRIFEFDYLREDIQNNWLTHIGVSPANWGDPYENPLLQRTFTENTGATVSLEELLGSFFGICWTVDPHESRQYWDDFSHGNLAVRVRTTVEKLLDGVMNLENQFYMLSHFLGKVNYYSQSDIDQWLQGADYKDFIDPLGQMFVSAMLVLRQYFEQEHEARLLYWHSPRNNEWVRENVEVRGALCRVPFAWRNVIDQVTTAPGVSDSEFADIETFVAGLNVRCVHSQILP